MRRRARTARVAVAAAAVAAAVVAARTRDVRIVVETPLGTEHPTTIAEELSVVDNLSGGRAIALVDTLELSAAAAAEDVSVLRQAWSGRWVSHRGERWNIPAGLHGEGSPRAISVTPYPAQLELPMWLTGRAAAEIDIKKLGIFPLVQGTRALALQYRLPQLSTADRLAALVEAGQMDAARARDLTDALHLLMAVKLDSNLASAELELSHEVLEAIETLHREQPNPAP